jgi:hypothetical protein
VGMRRDFRSRCLPMTDVLLAELPERKIKTFCESMNISGPRFCVANSCGQAR